MSKRHKVRGFIGGIANHETLVTGTDLLFFFVFMDTLGNLWGLLIEGHDDGGSFVVHSDFSGVIPDFLDGLSSDEFDVGFCGGTDLSEDHADGVLDCGLACHHGVGIFGETGVEDGIGDIVTEFVGVAAGDAFRCE